MIETGCPFIDRVPKDPAKNLRWRIKLRQLAAKDVGFQRGLREAAFADVLFWFNAFCFVFEPRALIKVKPFSTWSHQDHPIVVMDQAITDSEKRETPIDVVVDKSRAQGATWMYLMVFLRRWLRDPMFSAGLVTRNEGLVDSLVDSDTLMWKIDWMIDRLPFWMKPHYKRSTTEHYFFNQEIESSIVGYSATGDVASGGRKTVFGFDEVAKFKPNEIDAAMDSTQHVSNCRVFVSTHKGDTGVFYQMSKDENSSAVKIILDWKDNPTQNRLMYKVCAGKLVPLDMKDHHKIMVYSKEHAEDLKKIERRGHPMEGMIRSPWYDAQCLRPRATPRSIAQELDRNPRGSVGKVFDVAILDKMRAEHVRPPVFQGNVVYDAETLEVTGLIQREGGPLKLWFEPGLGRKPPRSDYVLGCDISAGGTGNYSSNSVAFGIDKQSGCQVLEYTVMGSMATKFARLSTALAKWLYDCYLIWEATGPTGQSFGKEVLDVLHYSNVYYRDADIVGSRKKTKKPGWWNGTEQAKGDLFEAACIAMEDGRFIPRSEEYLRECGEYEWEDGKVVHKPTKDAGESEKGHGDRCVAGGVAIMGCLDRSGGLDNEEEKSQNPPYGSPAWRQREALRQSDRMRDDDDSGGEGFSLNDLLGAPAMGSEVW
jgi:hypothetical protein